MPYYGSDGWKSFLHWQDVVRITLSFFGLIKKKKALRLADWKINIKINAMTATATIPTSDILPDQNAYFPSFEVAVQNTGLYMYP
jgi:hypothetical protein